MIKKFFVLFSLFIFVFSCSGYSSQEIFIRPNIEADNVKVSVSYNEGSKEDVTLPASVIVKRGNVPLAIKVKDSKCYKKSTQYFPPKSRTHPGLIFLMQFGLTTTTVNKFSDSGYSYEDTVFVNVNKKSGCQ